MALTDAQAKIIAANKKKKEEEETRKLAAAMLVNATKPKASSFPIVTPSKVVANQVTTPLKDREPTDQYTPKKYTTTRKTTSLLSDMGSRDRSILDRMRSDSGRLYTPLDVIRDRISIGDTAQTLAYRARQQDNDSWQERLQKAAEERVKRQEELSKYTLSEADQKLPSHRKQMVLEAKDAWQKAKDAGDLSGMSRAHQKAESVRNWAGYSGGAAGDEFITAQLTKDDIYHLNQLGQTELKTAMMARQRAIAEGDIQAQMKASAEIQRIRNEPIYKNQVDNADAYGRPMMTAEERLEDAARAMAGVKSVGTGVAGSLLSLAETGNQAMRNYTRERWGRNLEANANQYEDPLLAQKARARLGESTIVDPNLPGQSLMRKSQEYAAEALDGTSGVEKFLGEAALSVGQNLPGIALAMIPGAQGAGLALLGAQAAGARAWELNEQSSQAFLASLILGGDPEDYGSVEPGEALLRGLASGGVELLTEKIPLDNLSKILRGKSGQNGLKSVLKQMGIEGVEEGTAYTANFLLDKIAQDPNAEWTVEEFLKNAAIGAVSGGAIAGGATALRGAVEASRYAPSASQPQERTVESVLRNRAEEPAQEQIPSEAKASDNEVRTEVRTAQEATEEPVEAPRGQEATTPPETRMAQPVQAREALVTTPAIQQREQQKKGKQVKLKRIESIPAEVEVVQSKRVTTPVVSVNYLSEMSSTLGKSGSKAMQVAWDGKGNQAQYASDFIRVYNQALTGTSTGRIQAPDSLSDAQVKAAYDAGKNDRRFSLEEAKTAAQFALVAGKDSGLVYDDYVKAEMDTAVASEINTVAKQLGLRVQMVDSVKGGDANADIQGSVVSIEKGNPHPVRFLFGHEMTHRVQTLAPESYRQFRDFVMSSPKAQDEVQRKLAAYKSRGVDIDSEGAIDEIVADYAGQLIESKDLMKRFIDQNRKNQSMLSRFLTALKDLATKLTGRRKAQVNDAVSLLEKAVGEASKQAKSLAKNKNTAQTDGVNRYSMKDDVLALDGVDWMDNFSSIKDQLRKHADEVNAMEPVAVVDYAPKSAPRLVSTMMGEVAKLGGKSMKNNGVRFSFDEAGAKSINAHAKSHELRAAALASPYVAKYGKLIAGQKNHENTGLTTLTYAAPVVINDTTVNVGLAIQFQENGRPRAVNVGLQSGGVFKVDTKKAPKGLDSRVSRYGRGTSLPTMSASESTVARGGEDVKTRFSLKTPVEQTRNLVALHNLSEDKLMKSLDLGGFPMPSIAVTAADIPHTNFGDITLIMNKSTVDPKASKKNVVYSADAWTPTFPRIEYEVNRDAEFALYDKARKVGDKLPDMYANRVNVMAASIEDYLNNEGSEEGVIARFKNEYAVKALYLADKGEAVETKTQEVRHEKKTSEMLDAMLELFEEDVETLRKMPLNQLHAKYADRMKQVLLDHGRTEQQAEMAVAKKGGPIGGFDKYISRIIRYAQEPAYRTETVTDTQAMEKDIDRKVDAKGLDKWLNDMFRGLVKDTGVRNEKDIFTPSGKRRSFQQTHYPVTLDNIAKAMSRQNGGNTVNAVGGFYGIKTLRAGTAKRFKSIADMHKSEGRLKNLTEDEAKKVNDALDERLNDIISRVYENMPHKGSNQFIDYDTIGQIIMEVATGKTYTVDSIHKTFSQYGYKLGNQLCADIRDLLFDVSQMPVNIFEAKPERAVRFDEVLVAVVPDTASSELVQRLNAQGVTVVEYEQGNNADRLDKVNSVEVAKFSLKGISGYENLVEKFGAIEQGEDPRARDIQVPKQTEDGKKVSRTVRTILEAGSTTDEMVPTIKKMVEDGEFSYEVAGDKAAIETAEATIRDKGFQAALMDWTSSLAKGEVNKRNVATGWALYDAAAQAGDAKTAADIMTRIVIHQRNAAQAVQATRILKRMSPSAQLYGIQRSVQNMQEELNTKYGDKAPNLKVPDELIERYLDAENQEERDEAEIEIYKSIGKQMPSTFQDKWNAWRYLAMLFNVRTHLRNITGNAVFAIPVSVKNVVGTVVESSVSAVSGGKIQRTKGVATPELVSAAWADYKKAESQIMAGGKYDDSAAKRDIIHDNRVIFKNRFIEWLRKMNSGALQAEDGWACRPHYANALAQYCAANGITAEQIRTGEGIDKKTIDKARGYAIREAQKATFRDFNDFSNYISSLGRYEGKSPTRKAVSVLAEGLFPFRKTPANIMVRAVEYSPANLANVVAELVYNGVMARKGKTKEMIPASQIIDNFASGLTGTGLFAFGVYLASQGLLIASEDDDDKQADFDKLLGRQTNAIERKDGSNFTIDWMAPQAIPVLMGAELFQIRREKDGDASWQDLINAISTVTNPMLELSCLSSLNDTLDALTGFVEGDVSSLVTVATDIAISYLTQGVPTLLGQAERASQEDRMTTYTDKNLDMPTDWQYTIGKVSAKIPKWDYNQIPYIDAWGRAETETGKGKRIVNNFINPAYTSKYHVDKVEAELQRLYDAVGEDFEGTILPTRADRYFNVNDVRVDLNADQYVAYAKEKGQRSYALMQQITSASWYSSADDSIRAEVIKNAYQVANEDAKKAVFPEYTSKNNVYLKAATARDQEKIAVGDYLYLYAITGDVESLKYKSGSDAGETISNSKSYQIAEKIYDSPIVLTDSQRAFVYEAFGVGKTVSKANSAKVKQELATMRKQAGV